MKKISDLILKAKQYLINSKNIEYVMHYLITLPLCLLYGFYLILSGNIYYLPMVFVLGLFVNLIPEVVLPKFNIYDVLAGALAGLTATLLLYLFLIIN